MFATVLFVATLICDESAFQAFEESTAVHCRVYSSVRGRGLCLAMFIDSFEFVDKFNKGEV